MSLSQLTRISLLGRNYVKASLSNVTFQIRDRGPLPLGLVGPVKPIGPPLIRAQGERFYMRRKTVKQPPTKPIDFGYSGDQKSRLDDLDLTQPVPAFEDVEELQDAPSGVKKLFSLEFADGGVILEKRIKDVRRAIQEHPADLQSLEVSIAEMTIKLRNGFRHVLQFRKDKVNKSRTFGLIRSRNKLLKQLKEIDHEKFEWLCEKLDIKYTPEDPYRKFPLGKRAMRKKLAREGAMKMYKDKLQNLEKRLESEKAVFLEAKEKEMAALETEMKSLGVVDFSNMEVVLQQLLLDDYKPPETKRVTRRQLILEKKFELYKKLKAEQTPS